MAHYTVEQSCGHLSEVQLFGPDRGRYERLDWLRTVPCLDCKREAERAAAATAAEAAQLPALTGSPKQVDWALTIRAQGLAAAERAVGEAVAGVERRVARLATPPTAEQRALLDAQQAALRARIAELGRQASAAWWIDRRHLDGLALLREMTTPIPTRD